jgi:predicted AlkP superfamily phosphohydrolase/phosphomutase
MDWIDLDTLVELAEFQHIWLADSTVHLLTGHPWDLFFLHAHTPDWMYHTFATQMDPKTSVDREEAERHDAAEGAIYRSIDRMLERISECGGDRCLIAVTSDHGAKATNGQFSVWDPLEKAGLLAFEEDQEGNRKIDWKRTKAVPQRVCYIYVNVKGRDPDGIVEPGREYDEICDAIIRSLHDYTDPETGRKPVALALRRRDARMLGLYGDRIGDIVYAVDPGFGRQHGPHLPTAEWGLGSQRGLFLLKGPGVKKGIKLERTVSLTDIVPTVCHLADLPVPANAEGGIIYQALTSPDKHLERISQLQKNLDRLTRAFGGMTAETHGYNTQREWNKDNSGEGAES